MNTWQDGANATSRHSKCISSPACLFFAATMTMMGQKAAVVNLREERAPGLRVANRGKPKSTGEERSRQQIGQAQTGQEAAGGGERAISHATLLDLVNPRAEELPTSLKIYEATQRGLSAGQRDGWWQRLITHKAIRRAQMSNAEFNQQIWQNMPKAMLIMTPMFALLLLVLYRRTNRLFLEHLVFTLHTHTFTYLIFSAVSLLSSMTDAFGKAVPFLFIGYQFMALRRVYRQGFFRTALKTGLLLFVGLFIIVFAMLVVSVISGLLL